MKTVQYTAYGKPLDVTRCVEVEDVGSPGSDEVVVDIDAFPINPADLLQIEGRYASRPPVPATLGAEGVGTVTAAGNSAKGLEAGQRVVLLGRDNWTQRRRVKAATVIPVPAEIDVQQLAMLKVNPATARLMLDTYVPLSRGEYVIQNAANSGVGANLIRLAHADGIRTINVVRRESLIAPLKEMGADVVLLDGDDLAARVHEEVGDNLPRLAIDAVGGSSTARLAASLGEQGVVVNYGLLSGKPCEIGPDQLVFRDISVRGFWLAKQLPALPRSELIDLYTTLCEQLADGTLHVPVEATYPIDDIAKAVDHAGREGRDGKVLVLPNA